MRGARAVMARALEEERAGAFALWPEWIADSRIVAPRISGSGTCRSTASAVTEKRDETR